MSLDTDLINKVNTYSMTVQNSPQSIGHQQLVDLLLDCPHAFKRANVLFKCAAHSSRSSLESADSKCLCDGKFGQTLMKHDDGSSYLPMDRGVSLSDHNQRIDIIRLGRSSELQ